MPMLKIIPYRFVQAPVMPSRSLSGGPLGPGWASTSARRRCSSSTQFGTKEAMPIVFRMDARATDCNYAAQRTVRLLTGLAQERINACGCIFRLLVAGNDLELGQAQHH